ncbi:ABC transporter substrate-binding protein [Pelagibacterium xiamenense]|uniref:ABC transporter substrate-binding protein n=1 Tax=Pelagibacterium xiamenense TaxID=2901140 RepID=UPI001E4A3D8C|nr:extracellular solute-binding protein [Pelagibacterium xiamenense]MCD7060588.1 extracellular solute-binding protein [Pelagibacterium xiamenense]
MTTMKRKITVAMAAALLSATAVAAQAEDYTITVWSGGTGDTSHYRVDAIEMAADLLEREAAVRGEELNITVEKQVWSGWDDFKQAVTLAAESGTAPNIIVTGHEDIGPWAQAGILRPVEDYVDFDVWPLNQLYDNLVEVSSYDGQIWGIPQDAESRPFFMSRAHLAEIGYSEDEIDALPSQIEAGEYTLYDMLEDAEAMQDAGVVEAGMAFAPRVSNGPDYWQFYQSFGGEMVDPESGQLIFDRQALTDMYQFFVDAAEMGVVPATYLGGDWDEWHRNVAAGSYGMWHGGTWHKSQWENQFELTDFFDKIAFSLIPAGNENGRANTITHPLVYLISATGTDDEAAIAAELITIASEPRINSLHAVESGHLAIGEAQASVPLYANDRWSTEATEALLPHANAIPNNADFGAYWDAMYQGLEAAWTGTSSVEDAVNMAQAQVEADLGDGIIIR